MSCLSTRFRYISARFIVQKSKRHLSTSVYCQSQEILPDERLKVLVAELEKPLKTEDNTTVLLAAIESLRPKTSVLPDREYDKLYTRLSKSYNRQQLAEYLASKEMYKKGTKKSIIASILQNIWGIKTVEQVKEEKRKRVMRQFPATRQELFFIIGDNGNTIRKIEEKNNVNITIDVSQSRYLVEGQPTAVEKTKKDIKSHLTIVENEVQVPQETIENEHYRSGISHLLTDISKVSGSYISLNGDKFVFSSLSQETMDNAKRLLSLALTDLKLTNKKPLNQADKIIIQNGAEFNLIPFHDSHAMSLHDRQYGWSKLQKKDTETGAIEFIDLDAKKPISMDDIKHLLLSKFNEDEYKNVSLEARFGHLLCKNSAKHKTTSNLLQPISASSMDASKLVDFMPPAQLTSAFTPLTLNGGIHERSIKVKYINNSLLANNAEQNRANLNKLEVEFNVEDDGNMQLKSIVGEKKRSILDLLCVSGRIDTRLTAKQLVKYSKQDMEELLEKCKLLGVDRIEEQDKGSKRTEIQMSSVHPDTLDVLNSIERWTSFSNCFMDISTRWTL
ncbi:hypothetical protein G6F46_005253 [Rhizopus delemar]|uniref:K Homology domain-containing protein n=2 Tax=Rhizopus TaxID=4842 RepID=A0A9P7CNS3_9FUNG|nr:hypothetical protein G6F55_006780 [Rhizopus delemar]KAG1542554.1 hypothetical protein G6F51_007206 [Rhizopus arrhizus]KAG1496586.1 hypothetical protein G6F54_006367 [Rhizopus delemar]KAG1510314.1 hypothetical protein G6F53_006780 [Rhizopus delemar]KAG1525808.1 hypothetical protein G6F52_002992 [Rhizopus delemar]